MLSMITMLYPPSFVLVFLGFLSSKKVSIYTLKKAVVPLAILMGSLAYSLVPQREPDLLRYYQQIEKMKSDSLLCILKEDSSLLYTRDIIFWLIAKIGKPQLLAFVVGFVFYGIVLYILMDQIERSNKKFSSVEIAMLLVIVIGSVSFFNVISNVRCVCSFAIISFASYRDLVQEKRNLFTCALYAVAVGLHTAGIVFIAARLLQSVVKQLKLSLLVGVAAFSWVVTWVYENYRTFLRGNNFVVRMMISTIRKSYRYLTWTEGGFADQIENSLFNAVNRIYGTIFIFVCIVMLVQYNAQCKDSRHNLFSRPMVRFLLFIGILALGCLNIKTGAFWRFAAIFTTMSPVFFIPILEAESSVLKLEFLGVFAASFMMLAAGSVRLINAVAVEETILNFISSSGIKIIYECIAA